MLGSITPLGERGRGSTWWITVVAYVTGSVIGGLVAGAFMGWLGSSLPADGRAGTRLLVVGGAVAIGLLVDVGAFGVRLPTVHRQVDEAWRSRYRGWVW